MLINIDLSPEVSSATVDFTNSDYEDMWNILADDDYYFEESILDYLIENADHLNNPDNKVVELMNKLNSIYCNA